MKTSKRKTEYIVEQKIKILIGTIWLELDWFDTYKSASNYFDVLESEQSFNEIRIVKRSKQVMKKSKAVSYENDN